MSEPGGAFFGKYRGIVSDNKDPLFIGRVQAKVPDVMGSNPSGWALPCAPFGGDKVGLFAIPAVGALVWMEFEHGDPEFPIWSGCWWGAATQVPPELLVPPYQKVMLQTGGGHRIVLDDTPGVGGITLETSGGQKIKLTALGVEISNGMGASVKMTGPQLSINDGALEAI